MEQNEVGNLENIHCNIYCITGIKYLRNQISQYYFFTRWCSLNCNLKDLFSKLLGKLVDLLLMRCHVFADTSVAQCRLMSFELFPLCFRMASHLSILLARRTTCGPWTCCLSTLHPWKLSQRWDHMTTWAQNRKVQICDVKALFMQLFSLSQACFWVFEFDYLFFKKKITLPYMIKWPSF